jgi:multiple sugar transport system substrate-binding protein/raffinose/stachyose/melibiose transport system substrate-binding protein
MKRILVVVLMILVACSAFAGPGAESTSGGSGTALKGELNMFAWLPDNPDIVVNWVKAFSAKYPDVKLNSQMMTGNTLIENLQPRFASGNVPDIFSFELDDFSHAQVTAGKIVDVGDTLAWSDMVPAMQGAWTYGGVKYGISGGIATTLIYYNMDNFQKAGITSLPKNWDEFLAACEKLKQAGIAPLVWYGGFPNMLSNGPLSWGLANYIYDGEPDFSKNIFNTKYDFARNAGWLEIYTKMDTLNKKGYLMKGFTSTDYQAGQDLFNKGDAAMFFAGSWQAAYVIDKGSFKTGLMLPPWNNAGKSLVAVNASETGWAVGKNGNEKLGKVLLDFMFHDNWAIYQNPRGSVSPFKMDKKDIINPKLSAAMVELNKIPKYVDLFARMLPPAVYTQGITLSQSIYIDKTPADVIGLLTKAQNDWFATK